MQGYIHSDLQTLRSVHQVVGFGHHQLAVQNIQLGFFFVCLFCVGGCRCFLFQLVFKMYYIQPREC